MANIIVAITSGTTFTIPSDFGSLVSIEAIGSGGHAGTSLSRGGGGGGAYAKQTTLAGIAAGNVYSIQIGVINGTNGTSSSPGTKDTWFNSAGSTLYAQAGNFGSTTTAGSTGGQASACIPSAGAFNGGTGGTAVSAGAGGGGAGGPNGAGNNGTTSAGGSGDAGSGGAGGGSGATGGAGAEWTATAGGTFGSGGGGGPGSTGGAGGNYGGGGGSATGGGSPGLIIFTYTPLAMDTVSTPIFRVKPDMWY